VPRRVSWRNPVRCHFFDPLMSFLIAMTLLAAQMKSSGAEVIAECRAERVEMISRGVSMSVVNRLYLECLERG